ncbi:hypothetical protein QYF36_002384 [Acer negundo]|nr:hypothetical protein QYF36_002384 [Acer negundo]
MISIGESVNGVPLVNAGRAFADYHRLLAPGQRYEGMATMPGYKSKSMVIWLEEGAITVDFILDPDGTPKENLVRNICDCDYYGSKSKVAVLDYFWGFHFEICCLDSYLSIPLLFVQEETEIQPF